VDRGKVSVAEPYLPPPQPTPSSEFMLARLGAYWRALGVGDPDQIAALSEQALRRAAESPEPPGLDPVARVLVAAVELLDDWLARALDLPRPSRELAAARAALLSGAAPDWPAALFAAPGQADTVLDTLRAARAEPAPPASLGTMPAQRIELFGLLGPLRRLWRPEPRA
jgi:AcrR family transcriptional regulator